MSEKSREKIIEQLRKLNAMAESAAEIGNEQEAQAFAAKVQELLTAYKLSQADVGFGPNKPAEEPINIAYITWKDLGLESRRTRVGWTERLANFIAQAYYCNFISCGWGGNIGMFVGAETDRKVAVYMFATIGRFLYNLAEKEDRKFKYQAWVDAGKPATGATPGHAHGFKAGFIYGFTNRLKERFDEEINPSNSTASSNVTAIVLVRKNALDRVRSWQDDNVETHKVPGIRINDGSYDGRKQGRAAASALEINSRGLENTPSKTMHQIGAR
jgi:Protein of unknown function (DUF2786)